MHACVDELHAWMIGLTSTTIATTDWVGPITCGTKLDTRLLKRPPFLCRRLDQQDCDDFFVVVRGGRVSTAMRTMHNQSSSHHAWSSERFAKPCLWENGACSAGPRKRCAKLSKTGRETRNLHGASPLQEIAMDMTLNLAESIAFSGKPKSSAVYEAIKQAARLRERRQKLLRRASLQHIGERCTSQTGPGDKGVADCESWCSNATLDHCKFCVSCATI